MIKVLIAEDERSHRRGLVLLLKRLRPQWGLSEASNGTAALQMIREKQIDVLITDVRMPLLDGISLLKSLGDSETKPITVILSGYDLFEYAQKALSYGAFDYLLKPIDEEKILEMIEKLEKELVRRKQHEVRYTGFLTASAHSDTDRQIDTVEAILQSCMETIEQNYANQNFSLQDIAAEHYFSASYFSGWFKNHTGENFNHYLTRVRMEKAKQLIKEGNKIYEVAASVGYGDVKYFCRVFKQFYGRTPDEYRHMKEKGDQNP